MAESLHERSGKGRIEFAGSSPARLASVIRLPLWLQRRRPGTHAGDSVRVEAGRLVLIREGHRSELPLDSLARLCGSISHLPSGEVFRGLFLDTEDRVLFVPAHVDGFAELTAELSRRCGNLDDQFDKLGREREPQQWLMWQRYRADNACILSGGDAEAMRRALYAGFLLCTDPEQPVGWHLPMSALAALPGVEDIPQNHLPDRNSVLRFRHPVRIGPLQLQCFEALIAQNRRDTPAALYRASLLLNGEGDGNYFASKQALVDLLGAPGSSNEGSAGLESDWEFEGLQLRLVYAYDCADGAESGACTFWIRNDRHYPECWHDESYERTFELTEKVCLPVSFAVDFEWRDNPFVVPTPEGIQRSSLGEACPFLVWRDARNDRIGFANAIHACVVPTNRLLSLRQSLYMPEKGVEWHCLEGFVRHDDRSYWVTLATGNAGDFAPCIAGIEAVTGLIVAIETR